VIDITEILVHWYAGRSQHELAASLGVDRKTIRKYLAPALAAGITPGGPTRSQDQWAALVRGWFPELADTRLRQVTWPDIDKHRDYVVAQLKADVTAATIHQRLRDEHGLQASVASFRRWLRANLPDETRRAQVRVLGDTPPAGQEAQVDYGRLGMWTEPVTGRRVTVWAFVMVLAHSRHMFVRPVLRMDQQAWTAAHVEAFAFFGGVPARIVPDNLATGVERADLYDPKLNRAYAELAEHYGVLVDPARARKPRDKPRVERPMPYVRDSFWRGRGFTSIAQMQAAAVVWCRDVAGQRPCRPLDGAAPAAVFAAAEAAALQPLPRRPFELAAWSTCTVGPDIHVKIGKTLYSVPWRLIGQKLDARATWNTVQLFHKGQLVATHIRADKAPVWCRRRSREIGPSCTTVIGELLELGALFRLRSAQGVLGLADKHGAARLEAACAKAIAVGDASYRTIKGILAAGLESEPTPASTGDAGAPAHLHGQAALFDNVYPLTRGDEGAA
jgi:transposase